MANLPPERDRAIGLALGGLIKRSEGNLAPGIKCCAVCGLGSDGLGEAATGSVPLMDFAGCSVLSYSPADCMKKDRAVHRQVCTILRDIKDHVDIKRTWANQQGKRADPKAFSSLSSPHRPEASAGALDSPRRAEPIS